MSRISIPSVEQSLPASQPLLAAVKQQLGVVPNLMKLVGHSPAALEGYLGLNAAVNKSSLGAGLRERLALASAEFNGCDYCLSAHSYLGEHVARLSAAELDAARDQRSGDARAEVALQFAGRVLASYGQVADADLEAVRSAGFGEAEIIEIVVAVALNVLTNYVNNVAQTDVDFPLVAARRAA